MTEGKTVRLIQYGDRIIERTLVSVEKGVLFVCKREEYDAAAFEKREPVCIGFKVEDLV